MTGGRLGRSIHLISHRGDAERTSLCSKYHLPSASAAPVPISLHDRQRRPPLTARCPRGRTLSGWWDTSVKKRLASATRSQGRGDRSDGLEPQLFISAVGVTGGAAPGTESGAVSRSRAQRRRAGRVAELPSCRSVPGQEWNHLPLGPGDAHARLRGGHPTAPLTPTASHNTPIQHARRRALRATLFFLKTSRFRGDRS